MDTNEHEFINRSFFTEDNSEVRQSNGLVRGELSRPITLDESAKRNHDAPQSVADGREPELP